MSAIDKIRISCPKCHKRLAVKANLAGKRVRCPEKACATPINVPAPSQEIKAAQPRPTAAARWPWFAGGAAALVLMLASALGLSIWALNRGVHPTPVETPAGDPDRVAKTDAPTDGGASVNKTTNAFKPGDWFLWQHSIDGGKTSSTNKHTITGADDKTIFYEVESSSSANKDIKKDTGKFPVEQLGKSPIAEGDARNEILGKGRETLHIAGKKMACDWVEYRSSEAGDPMKYKINGVAYGETIVTTGKAWYSAQVPAMVVKHELRTSYIVPPPALEVFRKQVPADVASTYGLVELGSNATGAQNTAKSDRLTKENLAGIWEGTLKDGGTIALKFTDKLVVVSVLDPGINRVKAREAAEWVGAGDARFLRPGTTTAESLEACRWVKQNIVPALGNGGYTIGSMAYEVDVEKNEVTLSYFPDKRLAVASPAKDGVLLVSGQFKTPDFSYKFPETRIERVKPGVQAKTPQEPLQADGLSKEKLLGKWKGKIESGSIIVTFTDNKGGLKTASEWRVVSVWVDLAGGGFAVEGMAYTIDAAANEAKIRDLAGNTTVVKPTKDGAIRFSGRLRVGGLVLTFADTRIERDKPDAGEKTPQAQLPGAKNPDVAELIRKGGTSWSSAEEATVADKQFKAGRSIWIWPAEDTVFVANGGELKVLLRWKLRPAGPPAASPLGAELAGTGPGTAFRSYAPLPGIDLKTGEGTVEAAFTFRQKGEGDLIVYLVAPGKALVSNLLRLKVKVSHAQQPNPKKDATYTMPPEVGSLPKPKGPRLKELAKPPAAVTLGGIYLAGPFMRDKRSKTWPQAFAAGTDETCIVVVLRGAPLGTQVVAEVASAAGPVRLAPSTVRTIQTGAETVIELACAPASGVYADGDYTTRVLINRTAVAELYWCVGGKEPASNVIALAGTAWQSRYGDGSGYELRFSDGGKLEVHALPGSGKSSWQTKKGSWQQNGASFSGFADQDGPKRRRIEFRGKLIDGDLGIRIRNENEQGLAGSFGNRYEIPRAKKK
jgi:hypothetical protein